MTDANISLMKWLMPQSSVNQSNRMCAVTEVMK